MTRFIVIGLIILCIIVVFFITTGRQKHSSMQEVPMQPSNTRRFTFQALDPSLRNNLNEAERRIIISKDTERPFTGAYTDFSEQGTYYCKWCNAPLYYSSSKFQSDCGWPSFDEELPFAVERQVDADGRRTEILCATCSAHLGHVFTGEHFTDTNTRHCVNSLSLVFQNGEPVAEAVFAGGCFWGVEHLFARKEGVYSAVSGYTGGTTENPSYEAVKSHRTGHLEAVRVLYNPLVISYEELAKYFFEIHDPTQTDGQGPDIGNQYLSAVFYRNRHEFDVAVKLIGILEAKGLQIATQIRPAAVFYPAEEYHQDYYEKKGSQPYCHAWVKRF
ncbi:bifunctional methionine sulfoxide reductase B/A protein [Sphaerochaeta sp.]|uniref:bifunctional methionine sulfoxide reductase B/A protein n=1 Tax=Sphaerochaeta sp. TaxID=1972642 RepID=UPI002FC77C03